MHTFVCVFVCQKYYAIPFSFPYITSYLHCLLSSLHRHLIFCFHDLFVYILFIFLVVYLCNFTLWTCNSVNASPQVPQAIANRAIAGTQHKHKGQTLYPPYIRNTPCRSKESCNMKSINF